MNREIVISTSCAAIGYSPADQVLEVQFRPDRHGRSVVWQYSPVTVAEHAELIAAESIGKALFALRRVPHIQEAKIATIMGDGTEVPE